MTFHPSKTGSAKTRHGHTPAPLGKMLRLYRHVEQLSLRDLATTIGGVSASTLMRLEQGYAVDTATFVRVLVWLVGIQQVGTSEGRGR